MQKIKNLFTSLFTRVKGFNLKDWITYLLIIGLAIALLTKGCNDKKEPCPVVDVISIQDSLLKTMVIEQNQTIDTSPKGDTIFIPKIVYKEHTTFVKTSQERDFYKAQYISLVDKYTNAIAMLDSLTDEQIADGGGSEVWTFTQTEELPIIETDKSETGEYYQIDETIRSKGQLESFTRKVTVHPKVVTVTKTEVEYLKKNKFLALKFGILRLGERNQIFYTPSIEYGWKGLVFELGSPLDQDFNFSINNVQASAGLVFKFK